MTARIAYATAARIARINATRMGTPSLGVFQVAGYVLKEVNGKIINTRAKLSKSAKVAILGTVARGAREENDKAKYCFVIENMLRLRGA